MNATMQIVSVNVGLPREVEWKGRRVLTGIFKQPVAGQVTMRKLNLDGDRQADLTVHGGHDKAVYIYSADHYQYWRELLPDMELPWGVFGENLTVSGIDETLCLGDRLRVGSAEVVVTQPRVPCYKLGIRFGRDDILKLFQASGRSGLYVAVEREGEVAAGDQVEVLSRHPAGVTVREVARLYGGPPPDVELARRALTVEVLPEVWRSYLSDRLRNATDHD